MLAIILPFMIKITSALILKGSIIDNIGLDPEGNFDS
jgi:hypothetical protein